MRVARRLAHAAAVAIAVAAAGTGLLRASDALTTDSHRFIEIRNGIYLAQTTAPAFNSNALVVVDDEGVVVVDSHITPAKARQLLASIRALTSKPETALVNSHFHFDHAHGNQEFDGIPIIGHEYTRLKLAGAPLEEPTFNDAVEGNRAAIAKLEAEIASAPDATKRKELEERLALLSAHAREFDEVDPVPPDVTLSERLTLYRGDRDSGAQRRSEAGGRPAHLPAARESGLK